MTERRGIRTAGRTTGGWCSMGDGAASDVLARSGVDWILLDGQHGDFDRGAITAVLRRRRPSWADVLVRVPSLDVAAIGAALDAGADGVVVPLVDSAEEAAAAVAAVRYPPQGRRSWGPIAPLWGDDGWSPEQANATVALWVMVETREGLDALDEIVAVEGVDGVFVGPFDLSLALGTTVDELLAGNDLRSVVAACRAAGRAVGAYAGVPERAPRLYELGFDHVAIVTDDEALHRGAAAAIALALGT